MAMIWWKNRYEIIIKTEIQKKNRKIGKTRMRFNHRRAQQSRESIHFFLILPRLPSFSQSTDWFFSSQRRRRRKVYVGIIERISWSRVRVSINPNPPPSWFNQRSKVLLHFFFHFSFSPFFVLFFFSCFNKRFWKLDSHPKIKHKIK